MRTLVLILGSALIAACGHRERSDDLAFEAKQCGSTTEPREPSPTVTDAPVTLSASAFQKADGDLTVLVNPVVNNGGLVADLDPAALQIQCGTSTFQPTADDIHKVSKEHPAVSDLVFVIDTTGSMLWAINGIIEGISAFAQGVSELGLDARIGGIEFGDEIRSHQDVTTPEEFRVWVEKLGEIGGGDGPENPIDPILQAYNTFTYRRDAQRYFMVITDNGMHEQSDGTACADKNLSDVVTAMRGKVLFAVGHAGEATPAGVNPKALSSSMGGLYSRLDINPFKPEEFNIMEDTEFASFLASTHRVEVPAVNCAADPSAGDPRTVKTNLLTSVTVKYTLDGTTYTADVPLSPAP
jgi:hypothetical protein